mmetsp:Transcript_15392/g.28995  ORF Transcript_15392/g.28995 Transcript_15392/m.28995 type:complete len:173 (+) Transcript_15392:197-715(+)
MFLPTVDFLRHCLGVISMLGGASKILSPGPMAGMWPRLPSWFWVPAGLWEIVAGYLFLKGGEYLDTALALLFIFMGGVFCSVLYIKDENGFTLFSGRGKVGASGRFFILPGLIWSLMYYYILVAQSSKQESNMRPRNILVYMMIGFAWGMVCSSFGGGGGKATVQSNKKKEQ